MVHRDYRKLVKAAEKVGWELTPARKGGHPRLVPPGGWTRPDGEPAVPVIIPSTPSDHRSFKNTRADMRRAGIPC